MKKTFIFTTILAALVLTSCENFLKAKDVQSQIEESIAYANADQYTIVVDTEKGSGIVTKPAGGEAKVKPSDTFNLAFYAESDHQFIRWEVYNTVTNETIDSNDYLTIENPNLPDTSCSFAKTPANSNIKLGIRAITAVRPQIYFTAPTYIAEGVRRNSSIIVRFNHDMDKNSIYYTDEEKQQLKEELGLSDSDFLIENERYDNVCYGYKKDGKKHFKNIQIESDDIPSDWETQYYECSKDIYDFYDVPYFEDKYNRILIIPAKVDPPVASFRKLTITISKNFFYTINDNFVTLRESKSWLFPLLGTTNAYVLINGTGYQNNPYICVENNNTCKELVYTVSNTNAGVTYYEDYEDEPPLNQLRSISYGPNNLTTQEIPTSADPQVIRLGFAFDVEDCSGSGLRPNFTIKFCNASEDEDGSTIYEVNVPYQSRKNSRIENDLMQSYGYAGTRYDIYWVEIQRNERLSEAKAYCFQLYVRNYNGYYGTPYDNQPMNYWVKTTSETPTP